MLARTEELRPREHPGAERGSTTMTGIRLPISFSLSICTTVALFWFLGMLISGGQVKDLTPIILDIDFSRLIPDTEVARIPRAKPVIEKPEPPPSFLPTILDSKTINLMPGIDNSELAPPGVGFDDGERGLPTGGDPVFARGGSDRSAVPQVRIEPDYPPQAKERGIEGWITFRFTVAKDGSVKDIAIVDANPPRIWDRNTIRAVSTWKYQPKLENGKPVEQVGLMATYRYELDR